MIKVTYVCDIYEDEILRKWEAENPGVKLYETFAPNTSLCRRSGRFAETEGGLQMSLFQSLGEQFDTKISVTKDKMMGLQEHDQS